MHAQSCPTLCNPLDCSPPGSSVHGISQTRRLEWVAISFSRGSFLLRDWTHVSCIGRWILNQWATWEAQTHSYIIPCQFTNIISGSFLNYVIRSKQKYKPTYHLWNIRERHRHKMKEVWIRDTLHGEKLPGIICLLIEGDINLSYGRPLTLQQVIFFNS